MDWISAAVWINLYPLIYFQNCGKRFTEYSSLYKHHMVHNQQKRYYCSHCGRFYRQLSTLAVHKVSWKTILYLFCCHTSMSLSNHDIYIFVIIELQVDYQLSGMNKQPIMGTAPSKQWCTNSGNLKLVWNLCQKTDGTVILVAGLLIVNLYLFYHTVKQYSLHLCFSPSSEVCTT